MIYYIGEKREDYLNSTPESCLDWCRIQTLLVLDTETTRKYKKGTYDERVYRAGLDPKLSDICMLQIGNAEKKFIIDARKVDITFLKEILEGNALKILHNAKFDAKHLLEKGIVLKNVWDTMICERVLYNGLNYSYSLEAVAKRYGFVKQKTEVDLFNEDFETEEGESEEAIFKLLDGEEEAIFVDKSIRTQFVEWGDKSFTTKQIEYGATDLDLPLKIYQKQVQGRKLETLYQPTKGFWIENMTTLALAKVENSGIKVNREGWQELENANKAQYVEKKEILDNFIIQFYPKFSNSIDLFTNSTVCNIDWQSPSQVIKFFRSLNICPKEKSKSTGKIEWTVGAKSLFKLLDNVNKDRFQRSEVLVFENAQDTQALILNYLIFKKYQMLTTTFGMQYMRWLHPITGKIHSNFRQYMNTGRMSSSSPKRIGPIRKYRKLDKLLKTPEEDNQQPI